MGGAGLVSRAGMMPALTGRTITSRAGKKALRPSGGVRRGALLVRGRSRCSNAVGVQV